MDGSLSALLEDGRPTALVLELEPGPRQKLRPIFDAHATNTGAFRICSPTADHVEDLLWAMGRYQIECEASLLEWMRHKQHASRRALDAFRAIAECDGEAELPQPAGLAKPLRPYQTQGVQSAVAMGSLLICDVVGLGKTAQAIGVMAHHAKFSVVLCDTHTQQQWRRQIQLFWPSTRVWIAKKTKPHDVQTMSRPHNVLILPYSKVVGWQDALAPEVLILDECQAIRHDTTARYLAVCCIRRKAHVCVGLSATPIYNFAGEIFSVADVIRPGCLGHKDAFLREWCNHDLKMRVKNPVALGDQLRRAGLMIQRTRADVGRQLPKIQQISHVLEFDGNVFERLKQDANRLAYQALSGSFTERGQAAQQLTVKLRQATGIAKAFKAAEFVIELAQSEKVVVGLWHREVYAIIENELRMAQVPHVCYSGEESPTQKDASFRAFTGGSARVMLLSLRSGVGLDGLQYHSSTVVFAEMDYSPAVMKQFYGRVDRDGQSRPVTVFYLLINAGSDPAIAELLGAKDAQAIDLVSLGEDTPFAHTAATQDTAATAIAKKWLEQQGR